MLRREYLLLRDVRELASSFECTEALSASSRLRGVPGDLRSAKR